MKNQKRFHWLICSLFLYFLFFFDNNLYGQEKLLPQKYLVLDKYSPHRLFLAEGSPIRFSLKEDKNIYNDHIEELNVKDSAIYLAGAKIYVPVKEFSCFYFDRKWINFSRAGFGLIGGGFLISAAVYPLMGNNVNYEPREQAVIGASTLAAGQVVRLFKVKKFKLNKNSRIRILDLR